MQYLVRNQIIYGDSALPFKKKQSFLNEKNIGVAIDLITPAWCIG